MTQVRLFVAAAGNEFMLDIARAFREGFTSIGVACDLAVDQLPSDDTDTIQLVLAPHEFFPLFAAGRLGARLHATLASVHLINVEQPGSAWFELAWAYGRDAGGVFDISRHGAAEFRRRGITAQHAPLGYSSSFAAQTVLEIPARPIDVLFMGHGSPRREEFFSRHAEFFAAVNCRIILADVARPRTPETPGYAWGDLRTELVGSCKILLNVHSSERLYFEAHRACLALANRCLLVTETSRFTEPLQNHRDFIMAPLDQLPSLCRKYLSDLPALSEIAEQGHRLATTELTMANTCRDMIASLTVSQTRPRPLLTESRASDLDAARSAVISRLSETRKRRTRGERCWALTSNAAFVGSPQPAISVLVTLHNYAHFIESCLTSVARAEPVAGGIELIVVDDASTDSSADVARQVLDALDVPALLAVKTLNTGLADARNVGLELARGDRVFILDADNWMYPGCLAALDAAMSSGQYAATYGLLSRFDDETGDALGLLSMYDWSPADLVRAPYIDAMALFDRHAVLNAGGYATELVEHGWFGWEDYDLWLALAQAGLDCKLLPRIVGAYRVHATSMLGQTNRSTEGIARHFHRKFRRLAERYSGMDRYFGFPVTIGRDVNSAAIAPTDPEIANLRLQTHALTAQLAEVYASKSWRITAPLRLAFRLLTGRPQ
jgi:glycosyltransferase involved in cell wall biosynthesis